MKLIAIGSLITLWCSVTLSHPQLFTNNSPNDVVKIDSRQQQFDYVQGQILVRFKDEVQLQLGKDNGLTKTGMATVDALFKKYSVTSATKLFKDAQPFREKQYVTTFSGQKIEQPSLHNIYKIQINDEGTIFETIDELKKDPNVEYAEPNYIYSVVDDKPVSDILTEEDIRKFQHGTQSSDTLNDPLYSQQWYISAIHADAVWDSTQGDTSQIIGILDTGVDCLHPDLANKIWRNYTELNGVAGVDDDGNGFVDDIRGWDFINNDNDPRDDNSHGTHVAGIAAAEANNGIGIAGVNWKAKILPIKVFQSSGYGDAATITQGIIYAMNKGAKVINMSFGSYTRSITMEAALANAYANSILVAAAGNDGIRIGPGKGSAPFFPAALSYVLGVQAGDAMGPLGFSNYDPDGPVFSYYQDLLNYELRAPGAGLISTVPNGNYRIYSGTSMAAPVVSGAIALYKHRYPGQSQEMMWGNLISTTGQYLNLLAALNVQAEPVLAFVSQTLLDTLPGDNRNGLVDAGETVELWFTVRNTWGQSDSVFVGLKLGEFEDTSVAGVVNPEEFIGSISPYATRTNEIKPFQIHISPQVVNDRDIAFDALLWYAGAVDTLHKRVILTVSNGQYLSGVMDSVLILTPDKFWIVNGAFRVGTNGTLIIRPGTHIKLYSDVPVRGRIDAIGTQDSMITIEGPANFGGASLEGGVNVMYGTFRYAHFLDNTTPFGGDTVDYCIIENYHTPNLGWAYPLFCGVVISNSVFINCSAAVIGGAIRLKNNIVDSYLDGCQQGLTGGLWRFNNFSDIKLRSDWWGYNFFGFWNYVPPAEFTNNYLSFAPELKVCATNGLVFEVIDFPNQYWGTTDSTKIRNMYDDFWTNANTPLLNINPILQTPLDSAHGCVWKVLVNGKDAQDEKVEPVGVGLQRFDVYFNRAMDTASTPQVSFGVREPFTQQAVSDSGHWSTDHKVWTVYKTIKLYTGDGINGIRVAGAKDPEGFEIPIEDIRFKFLIDASGSASIDFTAYPGLGKIQLEWNNTGLIDLLGFNMYRFTNLTDTTYTEPVLINQELITDTLYTDYNVVPGKKYYYEYKVVRTDFSESDFSKIIGATALTSSAGDANGDLVVNVLDIMSMVSYILGQNPQPFILEASDINNDSTINVLDIIGVVNIILGGSAKTTTIASTGNARIELTADRLDLSTDVPVAGIQFKLRGSGINTLQFIPNSVLGSYEVASGMQGDSSRIFILFSMSGAAIPVGQNTIGTFQGIHSDISISEAIISNSAGQNIVTSVFDNGVPLIPTEYYLHQNYPNPFNASTKIQYGLPERSEVKIYIYNILGQQVKMFELGEINAGRYEVHWEGKNNSDNSVASGIYFYRFVTPKYTQVKKLVLIK